MSTPSIRRDSKICDVLESIPDAARILYEEFNLPCVTCEVAYSETLEEGLSYSGLDPDVVLARLTGSPSGETSVEVSGDAAS